MGRIEDRIAEGIECYFGASRRTIAAIAAEAQAKAEAHEKLGIDEGWSYGAAQSRYGCDWDWIREEEYPAARVFDCDGDTVSIIREAD